jgi:hypothetical protein
MPLLQLSLLEDRRTRRIIAEETYNKLDELRKQYYEKMETDAKYFASEQDKRDAEVNALLYEMQLDLNK